MTKLLDYIHTLGRTPVIPLMGYPGTQLTHTSIKQNEFNWGVQSWTLQALWRRFDPDGIFLFMDLAVEASALGLQVRFPIHESPSVEIHPVDTEEDLDQFKAVDLLKDGRVHAFIETAKQLKVLLPENVIRGGYITGPFTLAGLLCGANDIALNVITDPKLVFRLLEITTGVVIRYALALERAGIQVIAMLDPTAVILGPKHFQEFAGRFASVVISALHEASVVYHVCGNTTHLVEDFCKTGAQGLSLDSVVNFPEIAPRIPPDVVLIGNINPVEVMLHQGPAQVRDAVFRLREKMSPYQNFILSTGCDLPAEVPLENIEAFMEAGKKK